MGNTGSTGTAWVLLAGVGGAVAVALAIFFYPEPPKPTASAPTPKPAPQSERMASTGPHAPLPLHIELDPSKVALGDRLFHDARLSGDDTVACASCHDLEQGGVDGAKVSVGIQGRLGRINAPTVFNAGFNFAQFWDGRAATLEEQIDGPVHDPSELGSSWPEIVNKLQADPEYPAAFNAIYPDGITAENAADAIATFERSLYTPGSRFDQYLRGDAAALNPQERAGYDLFIGLGCVACHQGVGIGGNMYQRMGAKNEYFAERGTGTDADLGRFNVTGNEFDKYRFKVPSLRNVALTAPYFHDGSAATLEDAVDVMARFQLARKLTPRERGKLVAFLGTLTGKYKGRPLDQSPADPAAASTADGGHEDGL